MKRELWSGRDGGSGTTTRAAAERALEAQTITWCRQLATALEPTLKRARTAGFETEVLHLAGGGALIRGLEESLRRALGFKEVERWVPVAGEPASAVLQGMRRGRPALTLKAGGQAAHNVEPPLKGVRRLRPAWLAAAALLLAIVAIHRYVAPLVEATRANHVLEAARLAVEALPRYGKELAFRRDLQLAQLRALDVLGEIARLAPPGLYIKDFQQNQRGLVQFSGTIGTTEALHMLSRQLEESKRLSHVRTELSPVQGGEGVLYRIVAQRVRDGWPVREAPVAPPIVVPANDLPLPGVIGAKGEREGALPVTATQSASAPGAASAAPAAAPPLAPDEQLPRGMPAVEGAGVPIQLAPVIRFGGSGELTPEMLQELIEVRQLGGQQ